MSLIKLPKFLTVHSISITMSFALYVSCLFLPAYMPIVDGVPGEKYAGLAALFIGPLGLLGLNFSWFANLCLWFGWSKIVHQRLESAIAWCLSALAFALSFLLYDRIPVGSSGSFPFMIMTGYYVWIASIACALVAAIMIPWTTKNLPDSKNKEVIH